MVGFYVKCFNTGKLNIYLAALNYSPKLQAKLQA
jgi:hypothetical protein